MAKGHDAPSDRATQVVPRLVSAGVDEALQRFNVPGLLAAGKVNLISLEAVQARLGPRWIMRREQVFAFTARLLQRALEDCGFFLRISETDFFIVHPELGQVAGQTACLRYLREVLNHFLGEDGQAALGVLQVTRIVDGGLEARRIDNALHRAALVDGPPGRALSPDPPPTTLDRWTPFVAADGRTLQVGATLEAIYELKTFTRIGYRVVRRVTAQHLGVQEELTPRLIAALSAADLLRVDLAAIARGVDAVLAERERQLSLIVPLSYTSLASQRGRAAFATLLRDAAGLVRLGVICEIHDIEGVPSSALLAAVSLVRPHTLLVIGRLSATSPAAIASLQGAGLQGLSVERLAHAGDAEFAVAIIAAIAAAKSVAKSVLIYQVASPAQARMLAGLGASHASVVGELGLRL